VQYQFGSVRRDREGQNRERKIDSALGVQADRSKQERGEQRWSRIVDQGSFPIGNPSLTRSDVPIQKVA
jgi:hypothetical protein